MNLGMSWELDIWGRVRNATDAARAELMATEEFRRGVVLTLVADVAQAYAELMELDVELEVAQRNTATRQGTLDLFTKRSLGGVGNDLEVNQARADLAVTAAAIPATERLIALKESQLCGPPGPAARPHPPRPRPRSSRSRRRSPWACRRRCWSGAPTSAATEDRAMAATSNVGVAIANRLPKLSLDGRHRPRRAPRSRPPSAPRGSSGASAPAWSPPSSRADGSPPRRRRPGPSSSSTWRSTGSRSSRPGAR